MYSVVSLFICDTLSVPRLELFSLLLPSSFSPHSSLAYAWIRLQLDRILLYQQRVFRVASTRTYFRV